MSKDDVLDYIGYDYVTSHMDKKKKTRMIIKPHKHLDVDGLDLRFLDALLTLATELYLHLEDWKDREKHESIHKIKTELSLVIEDYNDIFPNRDKIMAHVFLEVDDKISLYFLETGSEEEAFQVMKINFLSDGQYYNKTTKKPSLGGVLKIIQLTERISMVVLLIDL